MRILCGIILVLALAMAQPACAQRTSDWRIFKAADGLAESFVTSVAVSQRSNVWINHYNVSGATSLNGYRAKTIPGPERGAYRIYESRSGQIWAGYSGGLQEYKNGAWIKYPINQIRSEFQTNVLRHARSIPLLPLKQGQILFLLSDELSQFNNEWPPEAETRKLCDVKQTGLGRFSDMTLARDGTLWIVGNQGLLRLTNGLRANPESAWEEFLLDGSAGIQNLQQAFPDDSGGLTAVADSTSTERKVIAHFDGKRWSVISPGNHQVRQAWKGADGRFWAVSINALLRQDWDGTWIEDRDVPAIQFFDVATEANDVFWLATSEGLLRHSPALWQSPAGLRPNTQSVRAIGEQNSGTFWLATAEGINLRQGETWKIFPYPQALDQPFRPGDFMFSVRGRKLVTGADGKLLCFDPIRRTFSTKKHTSGLQVKALGLMPDGKLCVQLLEPAGGNRLELFDGEFFSEFPFAVPPFPPNSEYSLLFATTAGNIWISSDAGLAWLTQGEWKISEATTLPEAANCFAEINGKTWCGTRNSVWEFNGESWNLLRAGFDRVNAITHSRDGSVWVASNSALFRYHQGDWTDYSAQDGLPAIAITSVFEDRSGQLWAGTTRGAANFLPRADLHPPRSFITKIDTGEEGSVRISFDGADKWKTTPADRLLFSHRLNEKDWSPFSTDRAVSFQDLPAGTHYFQVRAMDRTRNIDPQPALLDFDVTLPWYQETRLVLISLAGLGVALFFAALAFNRHRRLLRSYAEVEKIVEVRTKQLEEANARVLHSQKMTALGALAAGVAHDFNSILSIIKGSAQIIETNLNDREKIKVRTERIKTAVDQGSEVIKAMLGFSKPSENKFIQCDLNRLVRETIRLLGDRFERDIQVVFSPNKDVPQILGSPNLIQQILLNFILNAADALDGKGKITIGITPLSHLPANLVLIPEEAQGFISISITDRGSGIAPDMLPRIFEPFFTTKAFSTRRGTGLGLSMVYELAKEMGCGLYVQSSLGSGSVFSLIIPIRTTPSNVTLDSRDGADVWRQIKTDSSKIKN